MGKDRADLLQGTLDMLILRALQRGPQHGFGIGWRCSAIAGGNAGWAATLRSSASGCASMARR
jgi:hypothetical protein